MRPDEYAITITFPKRCPDCKRDRADPECECSVLSILVKLPSKPLPETTITVVEPA